MTRELSVVDDGSDATAPNLGIQSADTLTSLPSRDQFCRRVDAELRLSRMPHQAVAVLYLDLDRFKSVNSLHGRAVGDAVLQWVAIQFSRAALGAEMVSRVGPDEFACLVLGQSQRALLGTRSAQILAAVSRPTRFGAVDLAMTPSVGIAVCLAGETDATNMLRWAASAMYRARHEKLGYAFAQSQRETSSLIQFGTRMFS